MEDACIWYQKDPSITLKWIHDFLVNSHNCTIEYVEWEFEDKVIQDLKVTSPVYFFLRIEDDNWINEDVREYAEFHKSSISDEIYYKICSTTAIVRFDRGIVDGRRPILEGSALLHEETSFHPRASKTSAIIKSLTAEINGIAAGNVDGNVSRKIWSPKHL